MRPLELGLGLPTIQVPMNAEKPSWADYREISLWAEDVGLDTVWVPDELLWKFDPDGEPAGTWECVAMTAAVAAVTDRVKVGTWVLSALHRNPGLTVKAVEAIDEIAGGRLVFGFGAGHAGWQGRSFGYPEDRLVSRYEEALQIVVPLLRGEEVTYEGQFHNTVDQVSVPRGPRGSEIPLLLAGHGRRTVGLAVEHGDIWSGYATESSLPGAFADLLDLVTKTCEEQGRDPSTLGKSIGVFVEMTDKAIVEALGLGTPISGSVEAVAEVVQEFADMGVTMLELLPVPFNDESMERVAELVDLLDG